MQLVCWRVWPLGRAHGREITQQSSKQSLAGEEGMLLHQGGLGRWLRPLCLKLLVSKTHKKKKGGGGVSWLLF